MSNSYQAEAAYYMVASKKWSFVSFNGIGFDYGSTLSIEKSKARIIELQGEQISLKVKNQVYSAYEALDIINQRIELQEKVISAVKKMSERNTELYANNAITFSKYYETASDVISEERALVKLQMERKIKIAQIKRLLGLDSTLSSVNVAQYDALSVEASITDARRGAKHVWISLEGDKELMNDVFSVTYSVENMIQDRRMLAAESNLSLYFKAYNAGEYKITARIQLISGDVIMKEKFVTIE